MFQQLHTKICVIIILHLRIACSYRVYHLDGDAESQLLPKLRQVLQGYEISNYVEVRPRQNWHRFKPVGKSMFVKRFIPHGYKTGEYEYDSRLNTVYKPLYRYHVDNPETELKRSVIRGMPLIQKNRKTIRNLIMLMKRQYNGALQKKLLQTLKRFFIKGKAMDKKRLGGLSNLISKNKGHALRGLQKSKEQEDPLAPGKTPETLVADVVVPETSKEKFTYPYYPFWNFWTYQKTIVQDACPGNLVKLGNMCVSSIGHRRNLRKAGILRRAGKHKPRKLRYG